MYSVVKVERTAEDWLTERGRVLFTWSIINPNGPTLNCIGLRECGDANQLEIFYRWMHFHGGETYVLGYVDSALDSEQFDAEVKEILLYAFLVNDPSVFTRFPLVSAVPSFVTNPTAMVSDRDLYELLAESPTFQNVDWGAQLYYLYKFKSNFFDRGAEETRSAIEKARLSGPNGKESEDFLRMTELARGHLPGFQNWQPNSYQPRGRRAGDTEQWWSTIHEEDFVPRCSFQLAQAWVGSIYQYQSGDFSRTIAAPFEAVSAFLQEYQHALWPAEWDSDFLKKQMKL